MKNSSKFFSNKDCEYFPCHKIDNEEDFNCLFCYCPLYILGRDCGGNAKYTEHGIKDCSSCMVPHSTGAADYIVSRWGDIASAVAENDEEHKNNRRREV